MLLEVVACAVLALIFGTLAIALATEPTLWERPVYRPASEAGLRVHRYVRRVGATGRGSL